MKNKTILLIAFSIVFLSSCVSPRLYQDEKGRREKCEEENINLKKENKDLSEKYNEIKADYDKLKRDFDILVKDTTVTGKSLRKMTWQYDKLDKLYNELIKNYEGRDKLTNAENQKLLTDIQAMQLDLQQREDKLKELGLSLNEKENKLNLMSSEIEQKNKDLDNKSARIQELESLIAKKDSATMALKKLISDALVNFEGKGLTVVKKNGKVYVSMDEKLLFKSGSDKVNPKGQDALKEIAKVLETTTDVNINVEGHTDDVGEANYNWDLSVKRATSVVKIITASSKLDPKRITASGRGEFFPVEKGTTKEARAKNRRTEIILEPNLEKLEQLLNSEKE